MDFQKEVEKVIDVKFREIGKSSIGNFPIYQPERKLTQDEISKLKSANFKFGKYKKFDKKTMNQVYVVGWIK